MELRLTAVLAALLTLVSCHHQVVASSYTHYRLPTALLPDRYDLKIITHLDDPENLTFDGSVSIRFLALEDTQNITLHAKNLTIDESRIQLESYDEDEFRLCLEGIETVPERDYYIIRLCQTLHKGQVYDVKLYFSGILNGESQGYFYSSYVDEVSNQTRWLSATHFESTLARNAFPCFDEPDFKASFVVWLCHHKSLTALSNMPLEKQIPLDDLNDFVWSIFEESVPMSTYLVAYTVNDFAYKESQIEGHDVLFRTWCRRDYIDRCDYAAEIAPKFLQYFEDIFHIPFPLKQLDQIAIPDFLETGMENWGLITYSETALMYASGVTAQLLKVETTKIIAHEMAHQWFGNLVTMKWWSDLWLNEGFATYVTSLAVHHLYPEWKFNNIEALENSVYVFGQDVAPSTHPVSQTILNSNEIEEIFDVISYRKGSDVLRLIHAFLGQDAFFEGVRDYLTKYKYRNAEQDDLWAVFTKTARKYNRIKPQHDMKTIMDSWTLQSGYPLVKVTRNYKTGGLEVTQQRYLENSTISNEEANTCYWVPLSYTAASELEFTTTTPKAWLECDESGKSVKFSLENVTGANEWIIFNIQLSGIYRVMYDNDNWRLLQKTLTSDRFADIHVLNRAQIIDDVLSLAWGGYNGYEIAFDITEYLINEREYPPWKAAVDRLTRVFDVLDQFPQHQSYFKAYMRHIIEPVYMHVGGLNATTNTSSILLQIRHTDLVTSWACLVDLADCVETAAGYFRQWKLSKNPDEENKIPLDFRDTIYCTAIRHDDNEDWTFLWQRYKATNSDSEKINIIQSLGCSRNETTLRYLINLIFDKGKQIPKRHVMKATAKIVSSNVGLALALEFYAEHISDLMWDQIDQVVSTKDLDRLISIAESNHEYFEKHEKSISSAMSTINSNLEWIERNLEELKSLLQSRLSLLGIPEDNVTEY